MAKMGRKAWAPTMLDCERVRESAKTGATREQIAVAVLHIAPSTLFKYMAEHPGSELSESFTRGEATAAVLVAGKLYTAATDDKHPRQIDAAKFYLERKAGWKREVEVSGSQANPLKLDVVMPSVNKLLREMGARRKGKKG